jgi:hypothetical protein
VRRETGHVFLTATGTFDLRLAVEARGPLGISPYAWTGGARPVLRRAERLAGGRVHLVEVRPAPGGVRLRITGVHAAQAEVVAPVCARVRRALSLDADLTAFHRFCRDDPDRPARPSPAWGRVLRGTSVFEDVVIAALFGATQPGTGFDLRRLLHLGHPCPRASGLRAFPAPADLAPLGIDRLAGALGSRPVAALVGTLARLFARETPEMERVDRAPADQVTRLLERSAVAPVLDVLPVSAMTTLVLLGRHELAASARPPRSTRAALRWKILRTWLEHHGSVPTPARRRRATRAHRTRAR